MARKKQNAPAKKSKSATPTGQATQKRTQPATSRQPKITSHFVARKSARSASLKEKESAFSKHVARIKDRTEEGLQVTNEEHKGLGVRTTRKFHRGDLVCEYAGDLVSKSEGHRRDAVYEKDPSIGCYMYFFKHKETLWCVDATPSTYGYGRLINHGNKSANLMTKVVEVDGLPRLCFFATSDIEPGEELLYDYGDRRKDAIINYPWLSE